MTADEVRTLLYSVAKSRPPNWRGETPDVRRKIEELEDYLFEVARWRAELEEARLYMQDSRRLLEDRWDEIEGWQPIAEGKSQKHVVDAKRTIRPDLYDGIRSAKFLIERISEQIKRLERDEEYTVSRAYTMLTG